MGMKPVIYIQDNIAYFNCPGCRCLHGPSVAPHPHPWGWNGDLVNPTFTPSIKVTGTKPLTDSEVERVMAGEKIDPVPTCCHSFVEKGYIRFLDDCTHSLKGQTVRIEPWEDA